jgi:hypothetical protein
MGSHMKTTLDLADPLFQAANALSAHQKTTLSALVEEGLRLVMDQCKDAAPFPCKYQDFSIKGEALVSDPAKWQDLEMDWAIERIERSELYLRDDIAAKKKPSQPCKKRRCHDRC